MDIKPIKTEVDYQTTLAEIDRLFDAQPGTPEGDLLEVLVTLVETYEAQQYQIPLPDPIEAIKYHMERLNLTRRDLEQYIGSRARVSEVLNRKRPLTLRMIRNLHEGLGISIEILAQPYSLNNKDIPCWDETIDYYNLISTTVKSSTEKVLQVQIGSWKMLPEVNIQKFDSGNGETIVDYFGPLFLTHSFCLHSLNNSSVRTNSPIERIMQ